MRICNTLGVGEEIGLVVSILAVAKKGRPRGIAAALMRAGQALPVPSLVLAGRQRLGRSIRLALCVSRPS